MFRHVVLLKWKESATADERRAALEGIATLPGIIPEIRGYQFGEDAGLVAQGNSDLAIVADFDSVDDYLVYRDHPVHQEVIARTMRPILESRAAVQHELD
jgi:Stress responsive A/B Barrel Domain